MHDCGDVPVSTQDLPKRGGGSAPQESAPQENAPQESARVDAAAAQAGALALRLGDLARRRAATLATAESCTGGLVAAAITSVAGSSEYFDRGFVTYSNAAKSALLGVREETLARYGAVSEAVAREMAEGTLSRSAATLAVAVTGIAGPGGGTPAKPVGTVCLAWGARDGLVEAVTVHLAGDREAVRRASVLVALKGLLRRLGDS
jgi:nicotinamide-nucleotide amidase